MRTFFVIFLGLFLYTNTFCQSDVDLGFLPKVVLSKKLSEKTKWVNSLETRRIIYDEDFMFAHSLVDISSIYSIKIAGNQSLNFGYILRFRGSETIHRTLQHYNFVDKFSSLKIGHRFAFEQFYQSKKRTTYRTRYRLSLEKPLNGERVDIKEFYLKIGNEYLYDFSDLEVRLTPYLGYQASAKDKIEVGLDYRLSEFISKNPSEGTLWFRATWYISI